MSKNLTQKEASGLIGALVEEEIEADLAKSVLVLMREKGESAEEICGAVCAVREREEKITVDLSYLVDNCGTGGDRKGTFNVSTLAALVAAAAGAAVAKHGNRSVSSRVGSSDLFESLGVNILLTPRKMVEVLRRLRFGYFHAPLYHSVLKAVHGIRRSIRGRTIFNLIGPLLNPVQVTRQVIGVCSVDLAEKMGEALRRLGTAHAFVVCGEGGIDEITPYGTSRGFEVRSRAVRPFQLAARKAGFRSSSEKEILGGTLKRNRAIALGILQGRIRDAKRDAVLLNAALTLIASGRVRTWEKAVESSERSLDSGGAYRLLNRFVEMTNT